MISLEHLSLCGKPAPIGWFDLPFEMREMVIDEMDPKTRCRFAECSKLCEKEAKKSKNYLFGIRAEYEMAADFVSMDVSGPESSQTFYRLEFVDTGNNQTTVTYKSCVKLEYFIPTNDGEIKWTKTETGKPKDVRIRYFKEYLEKYKNSIRHLVFGCVHLSVREFSIKELRRLEQLVIYVAPKDGSDLIDCGFADMNQLLYLNYLYMVNCDTFFTYDNILEFTGEVASITTEPLNEVQLNEYLKMIKNREIGNIYQRGLKFKGRIEIPLIMQGLDAFNYVDHRTPAQFMFKSNTRQNGVFRVHCGTSGGIQIEWNKD